MDKSGFTQEFIDSLTDYERGRLDMQDEIIKKLFDYDAKECAQVAASVPIK